MGTPGIPAVSSSIESVVNITPWPSAYLHNIDLQSFKEANQNKRIRNKETNRVRPKTGRKNNKINKWINKSVTCKAGKVIWPGFKRT